MAVTDIINSLTESESILFGRILLGGDEFVKTTLDYLDVGDLSKPDVQRVIDYSGFDLEQLTRVAQSTPEWARELLMTLSVSVPPVLHWNADVARYNDHGFYLNEAELSDAYTAVWDAVAAEMGVDIAVDFPALASDFSSGLALTDPNAIAAAESGYTAHILDLALVLTDWKSFITANGTFALTLREEFRYSQIQSFLRDAEPFRVAINEVVYGQQTTIPEDFSSDPFFTLVRHNVRSEYAASLPGATTYDLEMRTVSRTLNTKLILIQQLIEKTAVKIGEDLKVWRK